MCIELTLNPPDGIIAGPVTEENYFEWEALITYVPFCVNHILRMRLINEFVFCAEALKERVSKAAFFQLNSYSRLTIH